MKRCVLALAVMLLGNADAPATPAPAAPAWDGAALVQLRAAVDAAPDDALPRLDCGAFDAAQRAGDQAAIDRAATDLALRLARLHLLGRATAAERTGWRIADSDAGIDLPARLAAALAAHRVDGFLAELRPQHSDYAGLRAAYAVERDPAARVTLARNMERWRWLPQSLGSDYVLVNTAAFEAGLWRGGQRAGTWKVIVGKVKTPTPVFTATITGVTFNPWWMVPSSIVRESVGSLMRRSPALARQRGYVWTGGRIAQRPGPGNSLGQMKLAMANPYGVYMHDTPNRDLFAKDVRAFSHGCMRVGDALGYAGALLAGVRTRDEIALLVDKGATVTVDLARPIPVYVTYFTAGMRGDGTFGYFPDIYGRDGRVQPAPITQKACGA